jgi:iron complex transport system permease protein
VAVWALVAATLMACGLRVMSGPGEIGAPRDTVELELRGMRAASAVVVGAALGAAGAMLQALTHNPLASPALLGTTSGAGLAVMVWILIVTEARGSPPRAGPPVYVPLAGALGSLGVVLGLAGRGGFSDLLRLILTGVVVGMIAAAGSMLAQHLLPDRGLALGARWFLGDLSDDVTLRFLAPAAGVMVVGVLTGVWLGPAVDAVTLDEGEALTMGAEVTWVRAALFFLAGLLTAAAVSLAGPIGFIGLIGPHLARAIVGAEHRRLILGSALAGALLLLLADAGVRLVDLRAGRIPVGVVTAVVGGPALLWLMRRRSW